MSRSPEREYGNSPTSVSDLLWPSKSVALAVEIEIRAAEIAIEWPCAMTLAEAIGWASSDDRDLYGKEQLAGYLAQQIVFHSFRRSDLI